MNSFNVTRNSFDVIKPVGVLRKTVVLEALNDYECNYDTVFMRVETEQTQVHPQAIQAAKELLRRASAEERERLQREIDVYNLASDFKIPRGPQPPVLGAIWILGARRELHNGSGNRLSMLSAPLPHKLSRGDHYDLTIETNTAVHLSYSHSVKESEDIVRWRDFGDAFYEGSRFADPRLSKADGVVESLLYGEVLSVPEQINTEYAINVIRDYKRKLNVGFSFELAHRPASLEEHAANVFLDNKRYGTGVNQNVKVTFGGKTKALQTDTSLMYLSLFFEEGFSKGETLPIQIDVSCPMFWSVAAVRLSDSTIEPAFELIRR